jgi:hypothetical protein
MTISLAYMDGYELGYERSTPEVDLPVELNVAQCAQFERGLFTGSAVAWRGGDVWIHEGGRA